MTNQPDPFPVPLRPMFDQNPAPIVPREVMKMQKDGTVVLPPDVTEVELRQVIAMLASAYYDLRMKHAPAPGKVIG